MSLSTHTDTGVSPSPLGAGWGIHLRYGLMGLPLAFVALPLYVHLPHVYASQYGVPLATLGMVLLLARLFDAVTDPWLGHMSDGWFARSTHRVWSVGALCAAVLVMGMALLFFPPWSPPGHVLALLLTLMLTCTVFSLLSIMHQSWGARAGGNERQRATIVAWREGAGLVGVVLASVLPTWLGWGEWVMVFGVGLILGWLGWRSCSAPAWPKAYAPSGRWQGHLTHPWKHGPFRRLMAVFVLSGLASAIPATLVLFFIQDQLNAPEQEPLFLATYFVAAAASMVLWMKVVARVGLARTWLAGMVLSVLVFAWAATLASGDVWGFWWVCALSGLALGTDLALPGALLAGIIAQQGDRGSREGAYFGWWNLASKLNLALAAGLALPLLDWMGYRPGSSSPEGLEALTWAYAVLPCAIKLVAAFVLYTSFVRSTHPTQALPLTTKDAP